VLRMTKPTVEGRALSTTAICHRQHAASGNFSEVPVGQNTGSLWALMPWTSPDDETEPHLAGVRSRSEGMGSLASEEHDNLPNRAKKRKLRSEDCNHVVQRSIFSQMSSGWGQSYQ
jgi:hypothetical protein